MNSKDLKVSFGKSVLVTTLVLYANFLIRNIEPIALRVALTVLVYLIATLLIFNFVKNYKSILNVNVKTVFWSVSGVLGFYLISVVVSITLSLYYEKKISAPPIVDDFTIVVIIARLLLFPFVEELFFRRTLLEGLSNRYNTKMALLISAILFALAHLFTDSALIIVLIYGLFFGYVYLKTKSLINVFILHLLLNTLVFFCSKKVRLFFSVQSHDESLYILGITFLIGFGLITLSLVKLKRGRHR